MSQETQTPVKDQKKLNLGSKSASALYDELLAATLARGEGRSFKMAKKLSSSQYSEGLLRTEAKKYGYQCVNMKKDGNCFYHAVSNQLYRIGIVIPHYQLRAIATQHVVENWNLYKDPAMQDEEFITQMSTPGNFADHIEIVALSRALNINIVIVRSDGGPINGHRRAFPNAAICLGYEVGTHYQSLIPQSLLLNQNLNKIFLSRFLPDNQYLKNLSVQGLRSIKIDNPIHSSSPRVEGIIKRRGRTNYDSPEYRAKWQKEEKKTSSRDLKTAYLEESEDPRGLPAPSLALQSMLNQDPWLCRMPYNELEYLIDQYPPEVLLNHSKDNVIEHAARRVDLFFYTLIAYYNTGIVPTRAHTDYEHGQGRNSRVPGRQYVDKFTAACHSSLFGGFVDEAKENTHEKFGLRTKEVKEKSVITGRHFMESLNSTVELPASVNYLDSRIEDRMRPISIAIIQEVARGDLNPIAALEKFLQCMRDIFEELRAPHSKYLTESNHTAPLDLRFPVLDSWSEWKKTITVLGTIQITSNQASSVYDFLVNSAYKPISYEYIENGVVNWLKWGNNMLKGTYKLTQSDRIDFPKPL